MPEPIITDEAARMLLEACRELCGAIDLLNNTRVEGIAEKLAAYHSAAVGKAKAAIAKAEASSDS
jgi:hypothetical protein